MKNTLLPLLLLCTSLTWSQSIPNNGFENWTTCPTAQEPIPFQTSNAFSSLFGGGFNVEQSTDAHGGNSRPTLTSMLRGKYPDCLVWVWT